MIGGWFSEIGGLQRTCLARVHADGLLDVDFNPILTGSQVWVSAVLVQPDGKILVGVFSAVNGQMRDGIVRLNPDGTLDTGFDPRITGGNPVNISSLALQADGRILIGGRFTYVHGQTRNSIARLNPDGALDTAFDTDPNQLDEVFSVTVQADGKILVGGNFLLRLFNDPAVQILTVPSRAVVQWTRSGAAPEIEQVTFDLSTNAGATWSPLGAGTRSPDGWRQNGLSLPESGTIRARGRITGGFHSGGSGLMEQFTNFGSGSPFPQWKLVHLGDVNAPNGGDDDVDGLRTILEYAWCRPAGPHRASNCTDARRPTRADI